MLFRSYLTDCNFRRIPEPRTPEDEMASEPWYPVAPNDVFPEEFGTFLLGDPRVRKAFMAHHADLLDPEYWQLRQRRVRAGLLEDVFPYPDALRFRHRLAPAGGGAAAATGAAAAPAAPSSTAPLSRSLT